MKDVAVIGGGFAGIAACKFLSRHKHSINVSLFDSKATTDFLPVMPDCLGRGISPAFLSYPIEDLSKKFRVKFINAEVLALALDKKKIMTSSGEFGYDYVIVASGSQTNFYGNDNIKGSAYKLDSVADASKISAVIRERQFDNFIIAGGGYTGIEVATNLARFFSRERNKNIILVERAGSILGPLSAWMKEYTAANLRKLRIEPILNASIERIDGENVYISGARAFNRAIVIWAAGVRTAKFIQDLNCEKSPQGRIRVDKYLKLNDSCFVAGDAADFFFRGNYLRMAVQFAILEGYCAAENVLRSIKGKGLKEYRPLDLGYIIPMANNKSCGVIFGINLKGFLPTLMHFMMCVFRSYGLKNKIGIIKNLIKGGL